MTNHAMPRTGRIVALVLTATLLCNDVIAAPSSNLYALDRFRGKIVQVVLTGDAFVGRLVSVSPTGIELEVASTLEPIGADQIVSVGVKNDSLLNGVLIGLGIVGGLVLVSLPFAGEVRCTSDHCGRDAVVGGLTVFGAGAAIGGYKDSRRKGFRTVYARP